MTVIVGRVMKENSGSMKVLEKVGMTYFNSFDFEGRDGAIYTIENSRRNRLACTGSRSL
jgi:[ribosomal protein S5]-alanine N-acetyltransferase